MAKRNIILTSSVLLILVVIIGIGLDIVKANTLRVAGFGLETASVTAPSRRSGPGVLVERGLVADSKVVNGMKAGALNVSAKELSSASLHLMDA